MNTAALSIGTIGLMIQMIREIRYGGCNHVRQFEKNKTAALISILDNHSPLTRPSRNDFGMYLHMSFKDRCEEDLGLQIGAIPDEPPKDLNKIIVGRGERIVSLSDAKQILNFFTEAMQNSNINSLVVHCKSGVGRSAAIANWLGDAYDIPVTRVGPHREINPNLRVQRLLDKAAGIMNIS